MNTQDRGCAYVDLDRIEENINLVKACLNKNTKIMLVVKADAYGHGARNVANFLERIPDLWGYAVATAKEGWELRRHGITKDILVLGYSFREEYEYIIENNITSCIYTLDDAISLSMCARALKMNAKIHIKIDTGMSRIGFDDNNESIEDIVKISKLPNIKIEGIFTHFARADEEDEEPTIKQLSRFNIFCEALTKRGIDIGLKHASNSAAAINYKEANLDMVRLGIIAYGMSPSDYLKGRIKVKPALSLISHVTFVKKIKKGVAVGYGGKYVADRDRTIATVPIGYGDGYPRSLSSKGYVLIHNKRANILGNICMDQFMVDVSDIDDVRITDKVILIGRDENKEITIDELGSLSDRFNYEFACNIGVRIPRMYISK